jgi:hypothetical protein
MQYSAEEKETTCVYDYVDNSWTVYTCVPTHVTKLRKVAGEPFWSEKEGDRVIAAKWKLHGTQIHFAMQKVTKMTAEQRLEASERMKRMHEARKSVVSKTNQMEEV